MNLLNIYHAHFYSMWKTPKLQKKCAMCFKMRGSVHFSVLCAGRKILLSGPTGHPLSTSGVQTLHPTCPGGMTPTPVTNLETEGLPIRPPLTRPDKCTLAAPVRKARPQQTANGSHVNSETAATPPPCTANRSQHAVWLGMPAPRGWGVFRNGRGTCWW